MGANGGTSTSPARRWRWLLAVAWVAGSALWFLLVVLPEAPAARGYMPGLWIVALLLGATTADARDAAAVGAGLTLPAMLTAWWAAPRDGSGLWVLWLVLLPAFGVLLGLTAHMVGWLVAMARRARRDPSRDATR